MFTCARADSAFCPLQRPYEIHSATPVDQILAMFKAERVHYSSTWCKGMVALLKKVRGGPSPPGGQPGHSAEQASQRTRE